MTLVIDVADVFSVVALVVSGWCLIETMRRRHDVEGMRQDLRHKHDAINDLYDRVDR